MPFVPKDAAALAPTRSMPAAVQAEPVVQSEPPTPAAHLCATCSTPLKTPLQKRTRQCGGGKCKGRQPPTVAQECAVCGKRGGKLCSLTPCDHCKSVMYCGREHQFAHWNDHRKTCKVLREQVAVAAAAAEAAAPAAAAQSADACAVCGVADGLTRCARCKAVHYCSRTCQQLVRCGAAADH